MRALLPAAALVAALALAAAPASASRTPRGAEAAALQRVARSYVVSHGHYTASQRLVYRLRVSTVDPRTAALMAGGEYDAISMVARHTRRPLARGLDRPVRLRAGGGAGRPVGLLLTHGGREVSPRAAPGAPRRSAR